jgi:pimeloyl-ACP methyl ester carboxylesterase
MSATVRPVVLVHGAWHGAWCWSALQAELDARGVPSYAVDLPGHGISTAALTDLHGDGAHVAQVLAGVGTDVVLVGHSYGGAVITQAAASATNVAHLVYLTAFVLDEGESVLGLAGTLPTASSGLSAVMQQDGDGNFVLAGNDGIVAALYNACPPAAAAAALARLSPQPLATFTQGASAAPWKHVPSTYVRCTDDNAIPLAHQDAMAPRCATIETLATDHSPFVSAVGATADIIERIARTQ